MRLAWKVQGFAAGVALLVASCIFECPLLGQCAESKSGAALQTSWCSGAAGNKSVDTASVAPAPRPGAIVVGDGTELADYWSKIGADAAAWYQHVQILSSPAFEGRQPGTRGMERAADYIEYYFREHGLTAPFSQTGAASFRQPVSIEIAAGAQTAWQGSLVFAGAELAPGKDFVMTAIAGEGVASGPIAFVGYAINEGPGDYSSFEPSSSLSGHIALVFRQEPLRENGAFRWGPGPGEHSSVIAKLSAVAARGAAGVLIVNPPGAQYTLPELDILASAASCCSGSPRLPTAMITVETANRLLRVADPASRDLPAWRRLADEGSVRTVQLRDDVKVTLTARVKPQTITSDNVAGALAGKGALKDQWLVIGGHYDHIGNGSASRADADDQGVLLGADDNASGTAVVLQLASRLSSAYAIAPPGLDLRSILFVAFTGEERGLIGSRNFLQYAPMPIDSIFAMINFDAVGRMRDNRLWLYGYGTAREFPELLGPLVTESGLNVVLEPGSHSSDQVSFQEVDIPVLYANTGGHAEYHTSRDLAWTVNPRGAARIIDLSKNMVFRLAGYPGKLTFQEQPAPGGSCCSRPESSGKSTPADGCCGSSKKGEGGAVKPRCCG